MSWLCRRGFHRWVLCHDGTHTPRILNPKGGRVCRACKHARGAADRRRANAEVSGR